MSCSTTVRKCRGVRHRISGKLGDVTAKASSTLQEIADDAPFATIPSGFKKLLGVTYTNGGKWGACICNPITKVPEWLGSYNTPIEAENAYTKKKLEFGTMFHLNGFRVRKTIQGLWYNASAGKWGACTQHPTTKVFMWLGTYDTPEYAYRQSKKNKQHGLCQRKQESVAEVELDLMAASSEKQHSDQSVFRKPLGTVLTQSGTWRAFIRHPITKMVVYLGTYDTPQEAAYAYKRKQLEFDSKFPTERKLHGQGVYQRKPKWYAVIQDAITSSRRYLGLFKSAKEAQEALSRKKCELDNAMEHETGLGSKTETTASEMLAVAVVSEDTVVVSEDTIADRDACSMDVDNIVMPMFESEVVNAYGELVGEFSRIDDELWLA